MSESFESMRLLLELALNSGKKRKSQQTGYLHYCYQNTENEPHLPIPLVENFLLALALLRSRTVENIQEAKILLDGLLHFQNKENSSPSKGNFPIYLHDFPSCKDRFIGIHVACVIYWILKQFHQVVGLDLKNRLEESLLLTVKHSLSVYSEKSASYLLSIKIASLAIATGRLLNDQRLSDEGLQMLEVLRKTPDDACLFCPVSMGSMLSSLLMVYSRLSESPWQFFWDHLQATWHRGTGSYAGPSLKESQEGEEPQVSLYDLFCGYFSGNFSDRALKESSTHLEAVLIPISDERFQSLNYPLEVQGTIQGANWFLYHAEGFAYSYIEKGKIEINQALEKRFHPFKMLWGNLHRAHTLVCQGGNAKSIKMTNTEMIFDIEGPADVEDREKNREILFFIDAHEGLEFFISEQKASTFLLDEIVLVKDQYLSFNLSFHLEEGEGRFLGHLMLGNRPSQLNIKGNARFNAYDWQIFLRTINRTENTRMRVQLKINH